MERFKTWEELTVVEQLYSTFSDMHKDVYGSRPRYKSIDEFTEEELIGELDFLDKQMEIEIAYQKEREEESVCFFETTVASVMELCGCVRYKAIKYLYDAEGDIQDWGHFCYNYGLPYNFPRK